MAEFSAYTPVFHRSGKGSESLSEQWLSVSGIDEARSRYSLSMLQARHNPRVFWIQQVLKNILNLHRRIFRNNLRACS